MPLDISTVAILLSLLKTNNTISDIVEEPNDQPDDWADSVKNLINSTGEELLKRITKVGVLRAYAFITKPNEMSEKLHNSIGFKHIGTLNKVGKKFEKYWDVGVFELSLPIKWLLL